MLQLGSCDSSSPPLNHCGFHSGLEEERHLIAIPHKFSPDTMGGDEIHGLLSLIDGESHDSNRLPLNHPNEKGERCLVSTG